MDTPNLNIPRLIVPRNFEKKRRAILKWFRDCDHTLAAYVLKGTVEIIKAQTYFKMKVEACPDLSNEDKQRIANESQLWKIPTNA